MEAIYFGNAHWQGNTGAGAGPWCGADLEQGMYYGGGAKTKVNNDSLPLTSDFVSLALKGRTDSFALKGGDATAGLLRTMYDGPRPDRKIAGTCDPAPNGPHTARNVELQTCDGSADQSWGFLKNGRSIGSGAHCLDISAYGTNKGSKIAAYYPVRFTSTFSLATHVLIQI